MHNEMQTGKAAAAAGALLVVAVAALAVIPWHLVNQQVPTWDGAGYVLISQKVAQSFSDSFLSGLSNFYFARLWRPIIFPNLAAPFFMLTSGNIRTGVTLMEWTSAAVMGIYVYLFLREIIGWLRAAVGASFVLTLTWFVTYTHEYFYSEPLWLAATAGTLFHFDAGLRLNKPRHFICAGLWLGLMVCVRPAETVALAFLPVCGLLIWAYRSGKISSRDFILYTLQVAIASAAVALNLAIALQVTHVSDILVYLLLLAAAILVGLRARSFFVESPILGFLVIAEAVAIAWHLPTMQMLFEWAYNSSFGGWAQDADQRFGGLSLVGVAYALIERYTPSVLLALVAVALVAVIGWRKIDSGRGTKLLVVIASGLVAMLPILVLHWLSKTSDERRIMPAIFLIYVGLLGLALLRGGFVPRIRLLAVAMLASLQLAFAVANSFLVEWPALAHLQTYIGPLREPEIQPDPNVAVLDGLLSLNVHKGFVIAFTHCLLGTDTCIGHGMPIFEHAAVSSLARERRLPIWVHYNVYFDLSRPDTLADQLRSQGVGYVLVDMFDVPMGPEVPRVHKYYKHTNAFINLAREGFPPGFSKLGCFTTLKRPICVFAVASQPAS